MNRRVIQLIMGVVFSTILVSCGSTPVGTWIEVPEREEENGFTLNKDGSVESINMGFYEFKTWNKKDNKMILNGIYKGSIQKEFSDTMNIVKLDKKNMVLEQGGYTITYKKK